MAKSMELGQVRLLHNAEIFERGAYGVICWPKGRSAIATAGDAIIAVEVVRIFSMLLLLRKINLPELENITIMGGDE